MSAADSNRLFRQLPSVDEVLRSDGARTLLARFPRWAVVDAARAEIALRRAELGESVASAAPAGLLERVSARLESRVGVLMQRGLRRVLNATGVVLHTNLGRAPLAAAAVARIETVAAGYSNIEYDSAGRERGSRQEHLAGLLAGLTGAEAAVVVNNNAGAVLLALAALAAGRSVVVSRGELVEIGGGFRIPDVMRASGARLIEVGTTNKTRLGDYLEHAGDDTALLLKVHRSNFAIVGFTEDVAVSDLAGASRSRKIPLMVDLGSGALVDLAPFGLPGEPTVAEVVRQGADLVAFSGDKLLGGPQAGIVVGRRDLVDRLAAHPLMRALRPDKLSLAALAATLELYRDGRALAELPVLRMLTTPLAGLAQRKDRLCAAIAAARLPLTVGSRRVRSAVGGGALPQSEPETWAVTLSSAALGADELAARLAAGEPFVVARIADGEVLLDVRTLDDSDLDDVVAALIAACGATRGGTLGMLNSAVLVLNRHYQPIHVTNAKRAFSLLYLGVARALDREFRTFDFENWAALSAEVDDDVVHTIDRVIRVPRVIVLQLYDRIPKTKVRFSRHNIYMRDGNTCQYCERSLPRTDLNLDHVVPRSQGGRTTWENVVCCCIDCNLAKGARTPEQAGMLLRKSPTRPRWTPTFRAAGDKIRYREWLPFLDIANASYWNVELREDD